MLEIGVLVKSLITVLSPIAMKVAEKAVAKLGAEAVEQAKSLLARMKEKWADDKLAESALDSFVNEPEGNREILAMILQKKLEADAAFASELSERLEGMGDTKLRVYQKFAIAEGVVGIEADEICAGVDAEVHQQAEKGEDVIGMRVKKIGG